MKGFTVHAQWEEDLKAKGRKGADFAATCERWYFALTEIPIMVHS